MSTLADTVRELQARVERLEGRQAGLEADVAAELRRADVALDDIVAALERLRARIDNVAGSEAPAPR